MTHVTNAIKERYRILYKPIVFLFVFQFLTVFKNHMR